MQSLVMNTRSSTSNDLIQQGFSQSCHQPPPIKDWTNIHVGQEDFLSCVRNALCEVEGLVRSQVNQLSATGKSVDLHSFIRF